MPKPKHSIIGTINGYTVFTFDGNDLDHMLLENPSIEDFILKEYGNIDFKVYTWDGDWNPPQIRELIQVV